MDESLLFVSTRKKARIEIIPLIDVVFFLLATFVLLTLTLAKIGAIEVPLPVPGKDDGAEDTTIYLQASEPGVFLWKQGRLSPTESITAAEIGPRLTDYKLRVRVPRVFIQGDDKAVFGATILMLDKVRKAEISQVSIETSPGASPR